MKKFVLHSFLLTLVVSIVVGCGGGDGTDTKAPVITLNGTPTMSIVQGTTFADPGATAIDDVDGNVAVSVSGTVDIYTVGSYTLEYTASDRAGNSAHITRTVTVVALNITYNGNTYGIVKSPYTGKIFLDRNLGAAQVCTSYDDTACYGDYYQWGRKADGHEDQLSGTTTTLATNIDSVGHSNFIKDGNSSRDDWVADSLDQNGSGRITNWSKTDGTFICPEGFRVPTLNEMKAELLDTGSAEVDQNSTQKAGNDDDPKINAFNSFLKIPSAGWRQHDTGSLTRQGTWAGIWLLNDDGGTGGAYIGIASMGASAFTNGYRAHGKPIRCIKN